MNTIKIAGKVIKKEKQKKNELFLDVLIAVPLNLKVYDEGNYIQQYNYFSFTLFGLDKNQYSNLRKGNFVEIIGQVVGNSNEDGTEKNNLIIIPKTIMKGGLK